MAEESGCDRVLLMLRWRKKADGADRAVAVRAVLLFGCSGPQAHMQYL